MGVSSSQLRPQELVIFKKLPINVPLDNIEIPERPENRRPTNVKWLIILGIFVIVLLPFMIYTFYYSDIKRLVQDYDKCGNFCGQNNYRWENIPCSGKNWTNQPYLRFDENFYNEDVLLHERHCVQTCSSGDIRNSAFKKCYYSPDSYGEQEVKIVKHDEEFDFNIYLKNVPRQIIVSCLLSIFVTMGMLFLFRYATAFVVWGILVGCFIVVKSIVIALWKSYMNIPEQFNKPNSPKGVILTVAIISSIIAIGVGLLLIWSRKKTKLVIMLLKEATKAVFDMPGLITFPVICIIVIIILSFLFGITSTVMISAGTLQPLDSDFYYYAKNSVMIVTMVYNFVVFLWLAEFCTGILYMVIAGAVSKWYFARDKNFLGSPILTSTANAFRFHLGTVAIGSLVITTVQLIKVIFLGLISIQRIRILTQCCIKNIETFLKFLSKNAYVITAMHGQGFLKSGKRAAKLMIQNSKDIIAINFIGDFVLFTAKLLIIMITLLLSVGISVTTSENISFSAYFIILIVTTIIACVSLDVFGTAIDTIFICYCEDNLLNDGMARPYFMSRNLMEFMECSKKGRCKKVKKELEGLKEKN